MKKISVIILAIIMVFTCAVTASAVSCPHPLFATKNKIEKASIQSDGYIGGKYCRICKKVYYKKKVIYGIEEITKSQSTFAYDGKEKKPTITVKDSKGNALKEGTDFKVTYDSGRTNIGKYNIDVKFIGNYTGGICMDYSIVPAGTSLSSLTTGVKSFTAKWKLQKNSTDGYELQYSTSSSFKDSNVTEIVSNNSTGSLSVGDLKEGQQYYVRIRTYKTVAGKKYYSAWSGSKSVHTITQIQFPLSTKYKWRGSTYAGHGKAAPNGSAYSCIDIICLNSSTKGKDVYAVEDGTVVNRNDGDGRIIVKHSKKLVTTNGVVFNSYYSVYAHMSNLKVKKGDVVKRGQLLGKVSDKGLGNGAYHLHFQLSSAENGVGYFKNNNKKLAISPYYVAGFVKSAGKQNSYMKFDTGKECSARFYNHKPKK